VGAGMGALEPYTPALRIERVANAVPMLSVITLGQIQRRSVGKMGPSRQCHVRSSKTTDLLGTYDFLP